MRQTHLILILICATFIGLSAALIFYSHFLVNDIRYIPMDLRISDHGGINTDTDAIHFGRVTSPGGSDKFINISNTYPNPQSVSISSSGELAKWVSTQDSKFILGINETKQIKLSVDIPENVTYGDYAGTLKIIFKKILI